MTRESKPEEDEKVAFYNSLNILKRNIKKRRRRTIDRSRIFKKKKRNEHEKVHCPWCDAAFPAGGQDLEIHVEQHLAQVNFFVFAVVVLILFFSFCYLEQHLAQVYILFFGHLF